MIDLLTLIPRCHEAAKAKGFWVTERNSGEALMLVISELAEALEAHRKGRTCDPYNVVGMVNTLENCHEYFETRFAANIKDTVGDELADAYIRLCDYVGGFNLIVEDVWQSEGQWGGRYGGLWSNFGHQLLDITVTIAAINEADRAKASEIAGIALCEINELATREGIDLATHIDLKLRYNATREKLHGKSY